MSHAFEVHSVHFLRFLKWTLHFNNSKAIRCFEERNAELLSLELDDQLDQLIRDTDESYVFPCSTIWQFQLAWTRGGEVWSPGKSNCGDVVRSFGILGGLRLCMERRLKSVAWSNFVFGRYVDYVEEC